jgi:hypothetical protein
MKTRKHKIQIWPLAGIILLVLALVLQTSLSSKVSAAQITSRKLTLSSSTPSASATWTFTFSTPGTTALNGIAIQICTTASSGCTAPGTGGNWDRSSAAFASLTYNGAAQGGWAIDNSTSPCDGGTYLCIKNNSSANATANPIEVTFSTVANPDTTNTSFYGRITTYTGDDFTGALDSGVVAASTSTAIVLTGYMPESLVFCTGGTVSTTAGLPDCTTATAGGITLPDFSPTTTSTGTSQMAASTNAGSGYVITVTGPTLTSGGNTITAIGGTAEASIPAKVGGQFGLNLVANAGASNYAAVGADVAASPNGTNLRGQPTAPYATADQFAFQAATAQQVAASDNTAAGPTDAQIFTVTYIVNVPGSQPAGTYTSTLTYICTPTF